MTLSALPARSWLFAPGDSLRKMEKAADSVADIAIFDLEDAVVPSEKATARAMVTDFLNGRQDSHARLWVRINPLDSDWALTDLAAVMAAKPGGIMLPKSRGRADVETLSNYLSALEAAYGIEAGATKILVLVTETVDGMFTTGEYKDLPRVIGLTWGAEDLADELGASENTNPDGSYGFTYQLARSLCLLGARRAGVLAIDTIQGDFRDLERLRLRAEQMRRDGYRGMLAIHPAQVDVINTAFSPSADEIAEAKAIVDLFAANPTLGAIGYKGGMLDRPYLARAEALLRQAGIE